MPCTVTDHGPQTSATDGYLVIVTGTVQLPVLELLPVLPYDSAQTAEVVLYRTWRPLIHDQNADGAPLR